MGIQEHPDVDRVVDAARETITVGRVFGEAYEQGAPTVIPAAQVAGGGGGGGEPEDADGKVGAVPAVGSASGPDPLVSTSLTVSGCAGAQPWTSIE